MSGFHEISDDLDVSLQSATVEDLDTAAVSLARQYARLLDASRGGDDEVKVFSELGPKYLATLSALGFTPAARGLKPKENPDAVPGADELAALRAERARANGA